MELFTISPGRHRHRRDLCCMALAVVMIYQAIEHLIRARRDGDVLDLYRWQLMAVGRPYWGASCSRWYSRRRGIAIERCCQAARKAPI